MDHLAWRWAVVASSSDQHLFDGFAVSEKSELQLLFSKLAVMNESRLCEGAECYLNIEGILKDHTSWAPSGHVICREQYPIHILLKHTKESSDYHSSVLSIDNLKTKESAESIEIRSNDNSFDLTISKITGCIRLLKYNSRPVIGGNGFKTSYTRATTDNDRGGMELVLEHMMIPWLQNLYFFVHGTQDFSHYMHWKHYGLTQENPPNNVCTNTIVDKSDKARVVVTCNGEVVSTNGTVIMTQSISYVISPDGTIRLDVDMKPTGRLRSIPSLPRVGLSMEVAQDLEQIQYFGRGPHENYPDRKSSAQYGVWSTTPSEMGYNYIVPSENGSRSDCRWVSFRTRRCDAGLLVVAEGKDSFGCSALHHTAMEQEHATHTHNLDVRQDGHHPIHVNIDHQLMGVGGDVSWFPCVYPQFLVKPRPYKYS
jgi:beta-galactosidase